VKTWNNKREGKQNGRIKTNDKNIKKTNEVDRVTHHCSRSHADTTRPDGIRG